jgi:Family of unknown function (DUF6880)
VGVPRTDEGLADAVLGLIRTRSDLSRWSVANEHGRQMHEAVDLLHQAEDTTDPVVVLGVVEKAIASAVRLILKADDSSGIIGDAIYELLALHVRVASKARPAPAKLATWLVKFQFDGTQDFCSIDIADYVPALGDKGLALYRAKLDEIAAGLPPALTGEQERALFDRRLVDRDAYERDMDARHARFLLEHNACRLAVVDRDVEAIIATHARDRRVARWLHDTANALAEIGENDLAIDWAKQAADFDQGHQAAMAGDYWCDLLAAHRLNEERAARLEVFRRWPTASTAEKLHRAAGLAWPDHRDEVLDVLSRSPYQVVAFAQHHLGDIELAWTLAHNTGLADVRMWGKLTDAYEKVDPLAVLPVLRDLVLADIKETDARGYQFAARKLLRMRRLAAGTSHAPEVDELIANLREEHRRRPGLQREFDAAGL